MDELSQQIASLSVDEQFAFHKIIINNLPEHHPNRDKLLDYLGIVSFTRYQENGWNKYLQEAITYLRKVLALRPVHHAERSASLNSLATALLARFKQSSCLHDLDEAILLHQEALLLRPVPHADRFMSLNNLAEALMARFMQLGEREDLENAILLRQEVLSLYRSPHPDRCASLCNLAGAFFTRLQQLGGHNDLEEVILLYREALSLCDSTHPYRSISLMNLAIALITHFEQLGLREDLDEAILLSREALFICPTSHPSRPSALENLAHAVLSRFDYSGEREDLEEGILLHREVLILRPLPDLSRANSLNNLANALKTRFELFGVHNDLEDAILLHREALLLRPTTHPHRLDSLNNISHVILLRFEKLQQHEDLDEATLLIQEALLLCPAPHPNRSIVLENLAHALLLWFKILGGKEDLDKAIILYREALSLRPSPHPNCPSSLNNLANAVWIRFKKYKQRVDLDEAICLLQEAVDVVANGHPALCKYSSNMGKVLMHSFALTNDVQFFIRAMEAFRVASYSELSPVSLRIQIALLWSNHAISNKHSSAMEACELVINLLPRISCLGDNLDWRQGALRDTHDIAIGAAIYAITLGRYEKAIELLEAGRAVFWLQTLQLRTPMGALREVAPELEKTLSHICSELERGSHLDIRAVGNEQKISLERERSYFTQLNNRWFDTLEEVRALNGFEDFLKPSKISALQYAAHTETIVILMAGESGSHALIMISNDIRYIHLPNISKKSAQHLVSKIRISAPKGRRKHIQDTDGPDSLLEYAQDIFGQLAMPDSEDTFSMVLKTLWETAVFPIIQALKLEKSESPPTVRWCPTGTFSFLPFHAAGIYMDDMTSIDSTSDYIVSSYLPSISASLLNKEKIVCSPDTRFKMLAVIEQKSLPSTIQELQKIEHHVSSECLVKLGVPGSPASIDEVLSQLPDASIVHFACHGKQCNHTPLESALVLDDGELKISRIMKERMQNAQLAFLCACETAMGDENVPDEMMHLGATLLFSGFRAVIATMSMSDQDGPVVADAFYKHLFRKGPSKFPDVIQSARALHLATMQLRSQGVSFMRWVPFIHLGN